MSFKLGVIIDTYEFYSITPNLNILTFILGHFRTQKQKLLAKIVGAFILFNFFSFDLDDIQCANATCWCVETRTNLLE